MKRLFLSMLILSFTIESKAQFANCKFKQPQIRIDFGSGTLPDENIESGYNYTRVATSCPTDGHYTYTSYTGNCFRGDWLTLSEDHTAGDADGNMMLVNASHSSGTFLSTAINGLKSGTTYEFAVWLMNLCRISEKCPFPLLPNIIIRLKTRAGKMVAQFHTGEVVRYEAPHWSRYSAIFTTPPLETALILTMADDVPGGCGNDFALDDVTFRECVKPTPAIVASRKPALVAKRHRTVLPKPIVKKTPAAIKRPVPVSQITKPQLITKLQPIAKLQTDLPTLTALVLKEKPPAFPAPPQLLVTRANPLVKRIETEAGNIRLDLYDNGEIDGDTVSIYHNNILLMAHARLSQKPISLQIPVDAAHPYHELILVAENVGSIPPNTSLMIVTTATKRYEVFISSTEQKNAKVIIDLKK